MNQIHPEELFDLERQASLSESERAARDAHLSSCSSCRLEHGWRGDFAREALSGDADRALLDRAMLGAIGVLSQPPRSRLLRGPWASAGVGILVAGLAAAAVRSGRGPVPPRVARSAAPESAAQTLAAPSEQAPPTPSSSPALELVAHAANSPAQRSAAAESATADSAALLFAHANAARRSGSLPEALRLYRRLLSEFPSSREAQTSSVTMARLLLDTQGSAAEALTLFDRYTRAAPSGNLAEEAQLGRAESLARLGRSAEEAEAWRALLDRFPVSAHRARAEARLAEISPPAP